MSLLTACSDDDIDRVYTVGEADNAIVLKVGVSEGNGTQISTRGVDDNHSATANGGGHTPFSSYGANGTQLALRIEGTWTGKGADDKVSQTTSVTLKVASNNHNPIDAMDPVLYWDDYGTADPANSDGRTKGLTIYGIGVDGVTIAPNMEADASWTNFSWSVCSVSEPTQTGETKVIDQTNGWANYDLLTSNNIQQKVEGKDYDGTYKFDDYLYDKTATTKRSSNILEFTHAMTKITVELTAGEGFPGYEDGAANAKFQTAPTVTLEGFNYTGSVNVETKTSTPTANATANLKMHLKDGGAAHTATFDALVFPGNTFSATIANDDKFTPTSSNNILELNADGNIYKVTAAQLVKAIVGTSTTGEVLGTLEQGKNYILNITVKKTDLDITATILDWKTVEADEDTPKINVTAEYGQEGTAFTKDYDFFRSLNKVAGYDEDKTTDGIQYAAQYTSSTSSWDKTIYWPNHQTHYFFRGVYPVTGSTACPSSYPNETVLSVNGKDVISVTNVQYTPDTYPSDLAIGFPRGTSVDSFDETCKVDAHKDSNGKYPEGICATEGLIHMNFQYCMSRVKVQLQTTDDEDKVNIGSNTAVEILGCYNNAYIKLEDGKVASKSEEVRGNHAMTQVAVTTDEAPILARFHDAIIPQNLSETVGSETKQMKFRITVTNTDGTTDAYECIIQNIQVEEDGVKKGITEWEAGKCYVYTLTLKKTAINVTATLTDWVEVTAKDEVWF